MDRIYAILKELGFDEREIKIYLSITKSGDLTALQISKYTGIDRATTYGLLEKLIFKGIVSSYLKNGSKQFKVLSPKELLVYFKEKFSSLETIIPRLNELSKQAQDKTKCELFYGKEGLKTVAKDIINNIKKEFKGIGMRQEYEEIFGYFNEQAINKLNFSEIREKVIVEKGVKFIKLKKGTYRYFEKELSSPVTTLIYGDVVVFFIWKEPYFAIRIENELFRKAQEEYFNILWRMADKSE